MDTEIEENEEIIFYVDVTDDERMEKESLSEELCSNSTNVSKEENELLEELEESMYEPYINTEIQVNNEIKLLVETNVSEETAAKTLNDITNEVKDELAFLEVKREQLLNTNETLEEELEADKNLLMQLNDTLLKINEMVELLKENVEKLEDQFKESHIDGILEKIKTQYDDLELLKNSYNSKLEKKKDLMKEMLAVGNERNMLLKLELEHRQKILQDLKRRHNEMSKVNLSYDEEIDKNLNKKQCLKEKFTDLNNKKNNNSNFIENEIIQQEKQFQKLKSKKNNQIERFIQNGNEQKLELERKVEKYICETDILKMNISHATRESIQKEIRLNELKEQLKVTKNRYEQSIQQLKQNYEHICSETDELISNISSLTKNNSQLHNNLEELKLDYISKYEEKITWTNNLLQHQTTIHNIEMELAQKKMQNNVNRIKYEELQHQYEICLESFKFFEKKILKKREKIAKDLPDAVAKYEQTKVEHDRHLFSIKKKKDYILTTSKYLKENSDILRREVIKAEELYKNVFEENMSFKLLTEKKQNLLNELKSKSEVLNNKSTEVSLKSKFTWPDEYNATEKVKFNEIFSLKSTTESSENSSQPVEAESHLKTSFHEVVLQDAEVPLPLDNYILDQLK